MTRIILRRGETFRLRRPFPMPLAGWTVTADLTLPGPVVQPLRVRVVDGGRAAFVTATATETAGWPLDEEFGGLPLRITAARDGEVAAADPLSIHILPGVPQ